jgi:uncharacterized membrane protein YedE/YeeE
MDFVWAAVGGVLIGSAALLLLASLGRIAGISGIWASLMQPEGWRGWQPAFVAGLIGGGWLASLAFPGALQMPPLVGTVPVVLAGLLVGFGTRLGSGCTSGHGVCGLSRLSVRSFVATLTFIGTGVVTVALVRVMGGFA